MDVQRIHRNPDVPASPLSRMLPMLGLLLYFRFRKLKKRVYNVIIVYFRMVGRMVVFAASQLAHLSVRGGLGTPLGAFQTS